MARARATYRVTAKSRDTLLYPVQCEDDILNALITLDAGTVKSHEAEGPKPVVD